jgi:hypothetical protein
MNWINIAARAAGFILAASLFYLAIWLAMAC